MIKTKEIDVWIHESFDLDEWDIKYRDSSFYDDEHVKAKLTIELPERKKEFTESDIKKFLFNEFDVGPNGQYMQTLISELFND